MNTDMNTKLLALSHPNCVIRVETSYMYHQPTKVVLKVQLSCSRFEDGGCFHSLQLFHVFWSFPCLPVCIFSQKLYLRFSSACFLYVIWLCRKYRFSCCGLIYSFLVLCRVSLVCSLIPHSGCGFFPSSCRVCFHYFGCYILWVFM